MKRDKTDWLENFLYTTTYLSDKTIGKLVAKKNNKNEISPSLNPYKFTLFSIIYIVICGYINYVAIKELQNLDNSIPIQSFRKQKAFSTKNNNRLTN